MPQINFWQMEDNGVQFGGINNDEVSGYQIEYSTSEFVPGDGSATVYEFDSFPGSIDGLESDTQYYFAIRSVCGEGSYSAWEGLMLGQPLVDIVSLFQMIVVLAMDLLSFESLEIFSTEFRMLTSRLW